VPARTLHLRESHIHANFVVTMLLGNLVVHAARIRGRYAEILIIRRRSLGKLPARREPFVKVTCINRAYLESVQLKLLKLNENSWMAHSCGGIDSVSDSFRAGDPAKIRCPAQTELACVIFAGKPVTIAYTVRVALGDPWSSWSKLGSLNVLNYLVFCVLHMANSTELPARIPSNYEVVFVTTALTLPRDVHS